MRDTRHTKYAQHNAVLLDTRILRYMLQETIDLLDVSAVHADEACSSTDAAMALTRIDWMLMDVFNWLTAQMRSHDQRSGGHNGIDPIGDPVSIVGIDQDRLSDSLRDYVRTADRLHMRVRNLDTLMREAAQNALKGRTRSNDSVVLNIFGDPVAEVTTINPVVKSQLRLRTAFATG